MCYLEVYCLLFKYLEKLPAILLISSLIPLWFESIHCYDFYSFKFVPRMGSILVNISCELEKNVYSPVVGWSILQMSIRSSLLIMLFGQLYPYWFSACFIYQLMEEGSWNLPSVLWVFASVYSPALWGRFMQI